MSLQVITSAHTLMKYAHALGQARLNGTAEDIAKAEADYKAYADICIKSDGMIIHIDRSAQ